MRIPGHFRRMLLISILAVVMCAASRADDRCDIVYTNGLDQEIVDIRVKFSTPYDEPRHARSTVNLRPGGDYRIGVQGTTLPEMIIIDLATESYVFDDLSGLNPANYMRIEIVHEEGRPLIRRLDADGEVEGTERAYLTTANRPNAVDKDYVMDATSMDEVDELIREKIEEAKEELGDLERFPIEAGPIWNHDHALERCPEVIEEWTDANGKEARWSGHWWTTVPGEMSVCECVTGTADEAGTVIREDEGWGRRTCFPVFWMDWHGAGFAIDTDDSEMPLVIALRFRLPDDEPEEMLGEFLEDLRIDGFRPARFTLEAANLHDDHDDESLEVEIDFRETDDDKWDAHERIMEALSAALDKDALKAVVGWVEDEAFEKFKADGDVPEAGGVLCTISTGTFEVFFIPNAAQMFLE